MKKDRGITLIALIVTIIILIILATVSINIIWSENGIINKAKEATKSYEIAQLREELLLKIADIAMNKIQSEGRNIEKEDLMYINDDKFLVEDTTSFPVLVTTSKYEFEIDDKFEVVFIGKTSGLRVRYELSTKDYTNQDIVITIQASVAEGNIENISVPEGIIENQDGTYTATKNGNYLFTVQDSNGNIKNKQIVINNIDKLSPKEILLEIKETTTTALKIAVQVEDTESTSENGCSGIEKYEYYINDVKYESTQKEYMIENLNSTTDYTIYVIAYDKAGNSKKSNDIQPLYYEWEKWELGTIYTGNALKNSGTGEYASSALSGYTIGDSYSIDTKTGNITISGSLSKYTGSTDYSQYTDKYIIINGALHQFTGKAGNFRRSFVLLL